MRDRVLISLAGGVALIVWFGVDPSAPTLDDATASPEVTKERVRVLIETWRASAEDPWGLLGPEEAEAARREAEQLELEYARRYGEG